MKDRILFIDTETGGLDHTRDSLLSIGMVVWEQMEIIDTMEILVNDGILSVNEEALAINRIDIDEHAQNASSPEEAMENMLLFLNKHFDFQQKITLAGHNVHFDGNFLRTFFSANNKHFSNYFSHRIIDTSSIIHYLYLSGRIRQKAVSSDEAFALFDIEVGGRHTALGDAVATAKLFTKLLHLTK